MRYLRILSVCILCLSLMVLPTESSWAQAGEERVQVSGTRKKLATIVFAGLAGAILGLSTLSFHGRPQEHLSNIAYGFAVGVIGGAIYTTYQTATKPYGAYDLQNVDLNSRGLCGFCKLGKSVKSEPTPRNELGVLTP